MIEKVAAVIIRDHQVLVCRKHGTGVFLSPGGKIEPGETAEQCLRRELREELDVSLAVIRPFGTYTAASALEDEQVRVQVFIANIDGEPEPSTEIVELAWVGSDVGRNNGLSVGSVFAEQVIPDLIDEGMIVPDERQDLWNG